MRQHTTLDQTAKLIELGFEKPRYATMFWRDNKEVTEINYILGELLSFLPNYFRDKNKNLHTLSIYTGELGTWEINYIGFESRIRTCEYELIDAAFEMCVKLKEEVTTKAQDALKCNLCEVALAQSKPEKHKDDAWHTETDNCHFEVMRQMNDMTNNLNKKM